MNEDVMLKLPTESAEEEYVAASSPTISGKDQHIEMESEPPKALISDLHLNPSSSASSTSDSSSSDSDSESSSTSDSSDEKKENIEDSKKIEVEKQNQQQRKYCSPHLILNFAFIIYRQVNQFLTCKQWLTCV